MTQNLEPLGLYKWKLIYLRIRRIFFNSVTLLPLSVPLTSNSFSALYYYCFFPISCMQSTSIAIACAFIKFPLADFRTIFHFLEILPNLKASSSFHHPDHWSAKDWIELGSETPHFTCPSRFDNKSLIVSLWFCFLNQLWAFSVVI